MQKFHLGRHLRARLLPLFFLPSLVLPFACGEQSSQTIVHENENNPVTFKDISQASGIDFRHSNGKSGQYYFVETVASGGGFIDFDGDGDLDVYLLNGAPIPGYEPEITPTSALYRNDGKNRFTDVTTSSGIGNRGNYGLGLAVADYDNDGDNDLFVTNFGANVLYENDGAGRFSDVTTRARLQVPYTPYFSTSATFFDYDRDGDLDLYVCGYVDFTFETNHRCVRDGIQSYCDPDVYNGVPDLLYRNNGDHTFTDVSSEAGVASDQGKGLGVVTGDYNGDGWPDVFVANDRVPDFLYRNNQDGTFTNVALMSGVAYGEDGSARAGMGADFGDYDNNGTMDLYVTNFSLEPNSLFRNNGNATFSEVTFGTGVGNPTLMFLAFGTGFLDYDNDGWLDLFAANGHVIDNIELFNQGVLYEETNQLFRNDGAGRFRDVSEQSGDAFGVPRVHRAAAFGDVDNDGDTDILVTSVNGTPELLMNENGNKRNSLTVRLVGTRSNRNAIGARVALRAEGLSLVREVKSGYSYMAANDFRLHFGLGGVPQVNEIEVTWPDGGTENISDVGANQIVTITEGAGATYQNYTSPQTEGVP